MLKHIIFFLLLFLAAGLYSAEAQICVLPDELDACYEIGEEMNFLVTTDTSGIATYTIEYDPKSQMLETGTVPVAVGTTTKIPYTLYEPGFLYITVQIGPHVITCGAGFSPFAIENHAEEPADFDAFWDGVIQDINNTPIDPQITFYGNNQYSTSYRINMAGTDGRRIYGYLTIPVGEGPFPASVSMPPFGSGANIIDPEWITAERVNAITLVLSIHNAEPDTVDPNSYVPNDPTDPNEIYYKYSVQAGVQAINYIYTRPDFDGENLIMQGVSQGGGLAILMAGIDDRVDILSATNPALGMHSGTRYDRSSSFPYYVFISRGGIGGIEEELTALSATKYFDSNHFAKRFKGPAYIVIGYRDDICPPSTIFGAFNNMTGPKIVIHDVLGYHAQPLEYWNGRFDFIRKHIPGALNPPTPFVPITTGMYASVGSDLYINAGAQADLTGYAELNGAEQFDWPVVWEKLEGPGSVTFSNPHGRNTTVSFSAPGEYLLQFTATYGYDPEPYLYYSISDCLVVTVGN